MVLGNIGVFPVRVRAVLLRFGRLKDSCLVALRATSSGSRVAVRIRLDRLFASSCKHLRALAHRVAHRLGSRVLIAPHIGLIPQNDLPGDRNGTIHIGSLQGAFWLVMRVAVRRLSIFIRGGSKALRRILRVLGRTHVRLVTSAVTSAIRCNVCQVVYSRPVHTCRRLGGTNVSITLSSIFTVTLSGRPKHTTSTVHVFDHRSVNVSCLCSFLLNKGKVLVFQASGPSETHRIVVLGSLGFVTSRSLSALIWEGIF